MSSNRFRPTRVFAFGVSVASVEYTTTLGALLDDLTVTILLRALDTQADRFDVLAARVIRTGKKPSEPPVLDFHGRSALVANLTGSLGHIRLQRAGVLARRKTRTGEEFSVSPPTDHHGLAALVADIIGTLNHGLLQIFRLFLDGVQGSGERPVEIVDHPEPFIFARLHFVQLFLHAGCESHIEKVRESVYQQIVDFLSQFGRQKLFPCRAEHTRGSG